MTAAALTPHFPSHAMAAGPGKPTGTSWPDNHVFPSMGRARRVLVADLTESDGFDRLLLTTLQGVVNATEPRVYLIFDPVDATWLPNLGVQLTRIDDPMSLVERFRGSVRGAIVYDITQPDSINIATTLAGLEGCVVATAEQAELHGLPVVRDLRGKFPDPAAIYAWQMANLWPRCTHRVLVGLPPATMVEVKGVPWTELARETRPIRDSSNRGVQVLDLTALAADGDVFVRFRDADSTDGWGSSVYRVTLEVDGVTDVSFVPGGTEEEPYLFNAGNSMIGGAGNRFADGNNAFIYRFQPPADATSVVLKVDLENQFLVDATTQTPLRFEPFASFRDFAVATKALVTWLPPSGDTGSQFSDLLGRVEPGTAYAGWFANDVSGEWSGVELCSQHGVVVVAADFYVNATVLAGTRAKTFVKPRRRRARTPESPVYLTFFVAEGDNIQYCQRKMRELWDDPNRGAVPINWTVSPLLADIGPAILHHYQATATANDLLICGPSGAGYTYPNEWSQAELEVFTKLTGQYLDRTGMDVIYGYSTPGDDLEQLPDRVLQSFADHCDLRGFIQMDERGRFNEPKAPVPLIGSIWPQGPATTWMEQLRDYLAPLSPSLESPAFLAGHVDAWGRTPTDVLAFARTAGSDVKIVLADEFFDVFAQTNGRAVPAASVKRMLERPHHAPSGVPTPRRRR